MDEQQAKKQEQANTELVDDQIKNMESKPKTELCPCSDPNDGDDEVGYQKGEEI